MISVIISYCNNDLKFLEKSLLQLKKITDDIFVSYSEYALNGELEDAQLLHTMKGICNKYGATPCLIEYNPEKPPKYHHNLFRFVPVWETQYDYIMYLDCDEIIDGDLMKQYLEIKDYENYDAVAFKSYWYFRQMNYRAHLTETAGCMTRKKFINHNYTFSERERWEFVHRPEMKWIDGVTFNEQIMVHHYSWARSKEEMIKKVTTWAHRGDRDWISLIEEEFSRDFNGTDFVHQYKYEIL
jgi:hypothetical protein